MNGQILPQASLFLGIIPALILLYISLKGYDGYYQEKNIYLSYVAGLFAGFISVIIEQYTVTIGILFIILFPILEQLFKTMILNIKRLQEKRATTIYGLTVGLGFGSIFIPFSIISANITSTNTLTILLIIIGSLGIILMHGATGIVLGYGITTSKLVKYFSIALLIHLPITLIFYLTAYFRIENLQVSLVFYGIITYWWANIKILPQIKKIPEKRKRVIKDLKNKTDDETQ